MTKLDNSTGISYFLADDVIKDKNIHQAEHVAWQDFSTNSAQINNNLFGGAGYFAETHHAASYNVNQANSAQDERAHLVNSREFGSVDITTDSGMAFNPKYFSTAEQSYAAGAELFTNESGELVAKYAGQQIIVPSDQYQQILHIHQGHLDQVQAFGQIDQYKALSQISFTDRMVDANGVESLPLSYAEAHAGKQAFQSGESPSYAQQHSFIDGAGDFASSSTMVVAFVSAIELGPVLLKTLNQIRQGDLAVDAAGSALMADLKQNQTLNNIQTGSLKAVTAGGLSLVTEMHAGIAAFLVTFCWDVKEIYSTYQHGSIDQKTFWIAIQQAAANRGLQSLLVTAAVTIAGPIGLLAPVLSQFLLQNLQQRQWFEHGFEHMAHGWMCTVNQAAQISSQQWQLACTSYQVVVNEQNQRRQIMENNQVTQDQMNNFNDLIRESHQVDDINVPAVEDQMIISQLREKNLKLLSEQQSPFEVQQSVDHFLIENQNNRQIIEHAVLDALNVLAPQNTQKITSHHFLKKIKLAILDPAQLQNEANEQTRALITAQMAALRMLQGLQSEQRLSIEFIAIVQTQLKLIQHNLTHLQQEHQYALQQIYASMSLGYQKLRQDINQQEERISQLEQHSLLQDWLNLSHVQTVHGLRYSEMSVELRLCNAINNFIHQTEGMWKGRDLLYLQAFLEKVGIENLDPLRFLQCFMDQPALQQNLLHQLKKIKQTEESQESSLMLFNHFENPNFDQNDRQINNLYPKHLASIKDISIWDLTLFLLWQLKSAGFTPYRITTLDRQRQSWLGALAEIESLVDENFLSQSLKPQIQQLQTQIANFKLSVPLIGKFSVGKSTLLNTWLGQNIQSTNLGACTSYPTEFHYAEYGDQKVVVVSGTDHEPISTEYELAHYQTLIAQHMLNADHIQHVEMHLHNAVLVQHPDLVLVDTPGLESNIGSHEQALIRYSGTAHSSFILCVSKTYLGEAEQQFVARQYMFGKPLSLLICQEDLIAQAERESVRQTVTQQAGIDLDYSLVRGCSAHQGDLKGFAEILNYIEENKSEIFSDYFKQQVESLIITAHKSLRIQLDLDQSREQLEYKKQQIINAQAALRSQYEKEKDMLLRLVDTRISQDVMSTIEQVLNSRRLYYYDLVVEQAQQLQASIQADIQNAFQLATQQFLHPVIHRSAAKLNTAVDLTQLYELSEKNNITDFNLEQSRAKEAAVLGGVAGGIAALALGVTIPFLVLPGLIGGFLFAEKQQLEKARQVVDQHLNSISIQLLNSIQEQLKQQTLQCFEQIYLGLEQHLADQSDNIEKIEVQLSADLEQRTLLQQRVSAACQNMQNILNQSKDISSQD
ncbi:dynamin family protein [Acinetobacter bohemicus]|uniref:dynamin family protein n=1 Tax=Acinetobacter bohemicus TaxID=1435036 RepID=UPI00192A9FAD|nr:dynamin family protein [Acinetobacter bohemicus]CAD9196520.1 hypothetical protein QAC21B_02667 [Acinetobacter bohemicus]